MEEFSAMMEKSDQMAVVCILSHGGNGFVYGSDGREVKVEDIAKHLDNKNCTAMAGKPKLVVVQACQACKYKTIHWPLLIYWYTNLYNVHCHSIKTRRSQWV